MRPSLPRLFASAAWILPPLLLGSCDPRPAGPGLWLADAGAGSVLWLDGDLVPRECLPFDAPRFLELGGVPFVVGGREAPHACVEALSPGGPLLCRTSGPVLATAVLGEDLLALVATPRGEELVRWTPTLRERWRVPVPGARVLATVGSEVLVATGTGHLTRRRGEPLAITHARDVPGLLRLAVAVDGRRLFGLTRGSEVLCLSGELARLWSRRLGSAAVNLVADARGGVWVVLAGGGGVQRLGDGGALLERSGPLPCLRVTDAVGRQGGGLSLAAEGALLEVAADGRVVRTQGGFDALVGLAAEGPDAPARGVAEHPRGGTYQSQGSWSRAGTRGTDPRDPCSPPLFHERRFINRVLVGSGLDHVFHGWCARVRGLELGLERSIQAGREGGRGVGDVGPS